MSKKQIRDQFGANAAAYATSKVHAQGASLTRLLALAPPQPEWQVLDVATGAGHTAFAYAPDVARAVAADLTAPMLAQVQALARERAIANVFPAQADAEDLPFLDRSFDLVTCRIAAHHFGDIGRFLTEAARVLKPSGILAVVDNVVPGSRLRGKKAKLQRAAGQYVNALEKLRDASHGRCLSLTEWEDSLAAAGFTVQHRETIRKEMAFEPWATRMQPDPQQRLRLRAMILQAPQPVLEFLTPKSTGDRIAFYLTEAILISKR